MTQISETPRARTGVIYGRARWYVCVLVFAATTINYIDRQVLGLLAPLLQHVLHWSESQYGFIIMGFSIAYAIGYVSWGRLIDAIGTKAAYAAAVLLWSIASCLHALVGTVIGFAIVRFLLGLAEAGNFPAAVKSAVEYFPPEQRALAIGWSNSGMNVAVQLTPLFIPWIVMRWGWHAAFLSTGSLGFFWVAMWLLFPYRRLMPANPVDKPAARVSIVHLLARRESWALCIAKFLTDTIWWFYLYWLPKFLASQFGLTIVQMALPLTVVYFSATLGSVGGGLLAGWLIRLRGSLNFGRKAAMLVCALCAVPVAFTVEIRTLWCAVAIVALAAAAHQGFSANLFVAPADLFPPEEVGTMAGLAGTFGALGGVVFSASAGEVLQHTHSYAPLFITSATVYLIALLVFHRLAGQLPQTMSG
jgi:ACS family hexuronate transporter-like MFS transporter